MAISLKTIKLLWGRAGNRCAVCRRELAIDPLAAGDDESIIGDMAHIVARKEGFTRGDYEALSEQQRDSYGNLILLCKVHHKQIDDQPEHYTVDRLRRIKAEHEEWVRKQLSPEDLQRQRDDELYAAYVQEFIDKIDIDHWMVRGTWLCASAPQMELVYHERLKELGGWIVGRLWPHRYPDLEDAFTNFRRVLSDFLTMFNRHAETDQNHEWILTRRFYRSDEWLEQDVYDDRVRRYEEHTALVEDLFLELTRALNYICDRVREHILPSFRTREGAVLVERGPVGFDMHIERLRPEYRGAERTRQPYPGLQGFRDVRRTRDFCVRSDDEDFGDPRHAAW